MGESPPFQILHLVQPTEDRRPVDIDKIKELCSLGLSECPAEDRAVAWLVLLNVYSKIPNDWTDSLTKIVSDYRTLVVDVCHMDHWINVTIPPNEARTNFQCENQKLMYLIHGDILRSGRNICFFPDAEEIEHGKTNSPLAPFTKHMRRLERILYIFAQCNGGISYMQGFNELICPIYYTLSQAKGMFGNSSSDDITSDMFAVEALSLQCLQELLTATSLNEFYNTQDQSSILLHKLNIFNQLFQKHLPREESIMASFDLHPLQYVYRWLNLLFVQEHELPTLLIIWDSLLSHIDEMIQFSFYIAIAHIKEISPKITPTDFVGTLEAFQNPQVSNIYSVLKEANQMYLEDKKEKLHPKRWFHHLSPSPISIQPKK